MHSVSRRGRIRLIAYAAAAFLIMIGFLLSMYQSVLDYRRNINNSYLRAFAQVTSSVDRIDSSIQKGLYVTTPAMAGYLYAEIQAEAACAQEALGELPYANVELEQTAAFLAKVGDYASAMARECGKNNELDAEQWDTLNSLSMAVSQLRENLDELETALYDGSVSLSDATAVEKRLSEMTEGGSVLAGSEFEDLETNFPEVPTLTYDGPFSDHLASSSPKMLEGFDEITAEDALRAAANYTGYREELFKVTGEVEGELPRYVCSGAVDGGTLTVEITKTGGFLLGVSNSRGVTDETLTAEECAENAWNFLTHCGFEDLQETYRYNNEGRLTINFASKQDGVLCYPDLCSVTVAMDNGAILGCETTSYLSNHTRRVLEAPAVSVDDAREKVSSRLEVLREQLALIPTEGEYEVLCWEFACEAENGQHYIVCINAATGGEEKILILLEDENGTLTL